MAKIAGEHFERLRSAIEPWDTPERRKKFAANFRPRAGADMDRQYRFELAYSAMVRDTIWRLADEIVGFTDAHLETALRRIIPPMGE